MTTKTCIKCEAQIILNSPVQKYCKRCAKEEIRLRDNKRTRKRRIKSRPLIVRKGLKLNNTQPKTGLLWKFNIPEPDFNLLFSFKIPFDQNLSKNNMKRYARGHYYLNPSTRTAQEEIMYKVKAAQISWVQTKTYLEIFVEKPNNRADAINFIDTIADAISEAIQVNDRWFCIGRVDWQIKKVDPQIYITIKQDSITELAACFNCGRLLPKKLFSHRTCPDCRN